MVYICEWPGFSDIAINKRIFMQELFYQSMYIKVIKYDHLPGKGLISGYLPTFKCYLHR